MVRMRGNIVMYDDVVVMCGVEVGVVAKGGGGHRYTH
jgi:hypothetical protein